MIDEFRIGTQGLTDQNGNVVRVNVAEIVSNPFQPRKTFSEQGLEELSGSIREFGVIQPLLLRRTAEKFEIIAGERRWRAAKLAGLSFIPAVLRECDDKEMAELALIENLQREDLHFLEEALGYENLLSQFGLTQEILAKRVGKDQSTIANKIRLLKIAEPIRNTILDEQLSERHARALLRLGSEQEQVDVLKAVVAKKLNVRETEALIEDYLGGKARIEVEDLVGKQKFVRIIKDIRIYINTIQQIVGEMKKNGLKVKVEQEQDDEAVTIILRIDKAK